jgi:hypothetical protein
MIAVISSVALANGYTAYPIAYFSERTPPWGSLTQSWTAESYGFRDAAGRPCWTVKMDPWDFDVLAWVHRGKVKWIHPGDPFGELSRKPLTAFPYHNLPGRREQLVIQGDRLSTRPPPAGEAVEPFD